MENSLTASLNKGEFTKKNAYYINNGCQPVYYHIERENSRFEEIQTLDLNCEEPVQTVSIENNDALIVYENEIKVTNISTLPLKSITIDDAVTVFEQPLSTNQYKYVTLPEECEGNISFSYQLESSNFVSYTKEIRCDENIIIKPPAKFKIYNQSDLSATTLTIWEYPLDLRKEALAKFEGSVESPFIKPNQSKELYIDCAIDRFFLNLSLKGKLYFKTLHRDMR